ncbi:MAG: DUF5681 domain-containing protein [Pseudomonadota bacterium]
MADRKNGSNTDGRNTDGTFGPGNSGKPRGARHRVTRAIEALLDGQAEALTEKAIDLALEGDMAALRLCIERLAPARRDMPVAFELPQMESADDAASGASAVLSAVSKGELTPTDASHVMSLIDSFRRSLEATDLEKRIAALEAKK